MKLTIIYHVYADIKTLEKSLNSLFNQTCNDFEVIFIDDDASLEAKEILNKFDISDERFKVIRLFENYGRSFCYNLGLEKASGEYVYYAESKIIFKKDFVESIVNKTKEKKYDYINFIVKNVDTNHVFEQDMEITKDNLSEWIVNSTLTIRNKVLRKRLLEKNKITFVNYKNLYPIYLFEVISNSKNAYYISQELLTLENKNVRSNFYSYNLYDILESAFLLANKINETNLEENMRDDFLVWLPKLCLCDFLWKMFESYDNEKVLSIAVNRAWTTMEKIDSTFKLNPSLNLLFDKNTKNYLKNFKPTYNYVRKTYFN